MSVSRLLFKIMVWIFSFLLLVGFRVFPSQAKWSVSVTDPVLWVSFCERPVMVQNNLSTNDPYLGGQAVTFDTLTQSVLDDYNSIQSAYVRLVDASLDPAYDAVLDKERTIKVCFGSLAIGRGGQAGYTTEGRRITGCSITMLPSVTESAKAFVSTLTHEMGHCMGLDHAQDTTHAIMSYFSQDTRLQLDDKMGLAYIFPVDESQVKETSDLGFSCAPR